MWSILPAAAILLAQAQPDLAEKWCFERGQKGAQLCEGTETACNDLRKINPLLRFLDSARSSRNSPAEGAGFELPPPRSWIASIETIPTTYKEYAIPGA